MDDIAGFVVADSAGGGVLEVARKVCSSDAGGNCGDVGSTNAAGDADAFWPE